MIITGGRANILAWKTFKRIWIRSNYFASRWIIFSI